MTDSPIEKRSEPRTEVGEYHSVEFRTEDMAFLYQFKIWNISSKGMCLLVREDSDVLKHLKVGDILNMKYRTDDLSSPAEKLKTEIKHITKQDQGPFKGHYLVGLLILEKQKTDE
ncbi:MAG: hypothetical protein JRI58_03220 [Deltaproteobacteria bacterium]|nr:hypothetical protein [Deltaproteobacteria bacterium]MBW2073745.1 hypothetical protein [Deltaproteobacteria bacterium]